MQLMRMKVRVIKFFNSFLKKENVDKIKYNIDLQKIDHLIDNIENKLSTGCSTPILEKEGGDLILKLNHHKYYFLELKNKENTIAAIKIDSGNIVLYFKQHKKEIKEKLFLQLLNELL